MSQLLNLADRLLAMAQTHLHAANFAQTVKLLQPLLRSDSLPATTRRAVLEALGEAHQGLKNLRQARRHLYAALLAAPDAPELHRRLGQLHEDDDQTGDLRRAVRHYRKAAELAPDEADYQRALGRVLCLQGKHKVGLAALGKAVELAPGNATYLRELALRMLDAGKGQAARQLVMAARFQYRHDAAYARLWEELSFQMVQRQQTRRVQATNRHILPFCRLVKAERCESKEGTILRIDRPSTAQPHLPRARRSWQSN